MQEEKRVCLYVRVSSDEQAKEGISLNAQERVLKDYVENKGWIIFKIYKDEGISAKSIKGRKSFIEMLNDSKQNKFSGILITKLDRAFRNVKEALITLDELHKLGVDFISIAEQIDTTTPMGKMMFVIISAFAELERNLNSQRVNSILSYKFNSGLIIGKTPLGYKPIYKNKKEKRGIINIEIDPKESFKIKDIFNMTIEGKNYKEICNKYKLKPQSYYNILRNKVYIGIVKFNNTEKKGNFDPIINEETFNKANKIRIIK